MFLLTVKKKFIKELTVIGIVLTTLVAVAQGLFFPETPLWLVPLFFVFVIVMFYRFVKF